ncbi:PAS domain S-box protein [Flavobacterium sp. HNIBRBA15423]|uniref:PAS domain S-box protein n=1 Tax=Flavobacterium sp. HNIBRBA15423 TaxID=3458683 RepID=UPI004044BC57
MEKIADYKYALDESSIIAITDQKGIINYVNDNFCNISKYTAEELIGQDHRIINSGYHPKEFIKELWTTIANGKVWKGELKNKAKDGTVYWVDTTIVPFLNADNKPYQYVAIRSDITDRKKGEEELKKILKEISDYKYALDESAIVAITDQKGIITHVNANFCKISKYSIKELIGQDHRIINSGYHSKEFIKKLWKTIANGKVWRGELKNRAKDGSTYWVDTTIVPFLNQAGKPYQYVAIRSDITERKNGEEELKKILKEISDYKYALDESAIVAITDQKGIITHVNANFCKISKYSTEELIGQDHRIINSGYHSKEFIKELWRTIANGEVWKGELKNRAKDGSTYWVDTTIVPFLNQAGKPYQYVAIRSDITERKEGEKQIKKSNIKAIEHAQILELKNTQLVDFCNIVSHNLRAPLINISMLVDYLEQSEDEIERKEVLTKIKPVVNHLMDVFNELVESIQVKQDTEVKSDPIVLKDCLEKVLRGFETQIQEYEATIQIDLNEAATIYFPQKYMESILSNLISNALKYRSPNKKPIITIKTKKEAKNTVVLSVSDNGLGIDLVLHKDQIFKIRKTFHKHPDAKGFGLFMTKTQVEAMNGKIWAESQPEIGSTFFIEFKTQNI